MSEAEYLSQLDDGLDGCSYPQDEDFLFRPRGVRLYANAASKRKSENVLRGAKKEYTCLTCGRKFVARVADRKRGWARCCSKSCAATQTNKKTGNYSRYINLIKG